jgi:hypothetical protein
MPHEIAPKTPTEDQPSTKELWAPEQPTIAIFSSFRKFLNEVGAARAVFEDRDIRVSNPPSTAPINPGAEYVRFPEDDPSLSDIEIQKLVITRALASTAIYVVCPGGYTGRTASYEIGRAVEAQAAPLYFSEMPEEPLMHSTAEGHIVTPHELADIIHPRIQDTFPS